MYDLQTEPFSSRFQAVSRLLKTFENTFTKHNNHMTFKLSRFGAVSRPFLGWKSFIWHSNWATLSRFQDILKLQLTFNMGHFGSFLGCQSAIKPQTQYYARLSWPIIFEYIFANLIALMTLFSVTLSVWFRYYLYDLSNSIEFHFSQKPIKTISRSLAY